MTRIKTRNYTVVKAWNSIRTTSPHCRSDKKFLLTCKAKKKLKNVEQPESTLICKFGNRLNSLKMDSTSSPWLAKYLKLTPCWSKWSSLKEGQALAKLFKVARNIVFSWVMSQFYIQLLYKPHFGTWILLLRPFGQLRAVSGFEFFRFWGWFFQFFVGKTKNFFWKDCSVCTKKLHVEIGVY